MCCVCAGSCNHVGNHWYCAAHGGTAVPLTNWYFTTSGTITPTYHESDYLNTSEADDRLRARLGHLIERFGRWVAS